MKTAMAVTVTPDHARITRSIPWPLLGCVGLALLTLVVTRAAPWPAVRWTGLICLPLAGWCGFKWIRTRDRTRARLAVGARLARLPDDFYLLTDLTIPAPWGESHMDQVIISRFGIVVVGAGPNPGWMTERVEAIRSLLFAYGLVRPLPPVVPLILLPPGAPLPRRPQYSVMTLHVEYLRLQHLAPGGRAVLTDAQVETIAQCLLQARAAS